MVGPGCVLKNPQGLAWRYGGGDWTENMVSLGKGNMTRAGLSTSPHHFSQVDKAPKENGTFMQVAAISQQSVFKKGQRVWNRVGCW